MFKTPPSERTRQRGQVAFSQALDDLKVAKATQKTEPDKSGLQSTQAAINAISSILEAKGYSQLPAYSASELLNCCITEDSVFEELKPHAQVLDGSVDRDLFGNAKQRTEYFTPSFAKACYHASEKVCDFVKRYWKNQMVAE